MFAQENTAVRVIGAGQRRFVSAAGERVDELDALHERMVLIRDLVLPRAEPATRENAIRFQQRLHDVQRGVAACRRRRVAILLAVIPTADNLRTVAYESILA